MQKYRLQTNLFADDHTLEAWDDAAGRWEEFGTLEASQEAGYYSFRPIAHPKQRIPVPQREDLQQTAHLVYMRYILPIMEKRAIAMQPKRQEQTLSMF